MNTVRQPVCCDKIPQLGSNGIRAHQTAKFGGRALQKASLSSSGMVRAILTKRLRPLKITATAEVSGVVEGLQSAGTSIRLSWHLS